MRFHFHCWHKVRDFTARVVWGYCQDPAPREVEEWRCCRCEHREVGMWVGTNRTRWTIPKLVVPGGVDAR